MVDKNSLNLENRIMNEIKSGRVKLRSKYIFLAEKLGLNSVLVLSIVLAVLFFNLVLFYMKTTDNLKYLSFGKEGVLAFLESFPYLLVVAFILFLFVAGYLITKTDWSYKKPFKYIALSLVIFVLIAGGVLAYTNVSERIEQQAFSNRIPGAIFKPFLKRGIETRQRGIAGKIYEVGDNYLVIETPSGLQKINTENFKSQDEKLAKDQFIMAIGERRDGVFIVDGIRIINEDRIPMIRRGIHRRFGENYNNSRPMPYDLNFKPEIKECMEQCFQDKINPRECFDRCVE